MAQSLANPRGHDVNLRSGPQMREYEAIADRIASDRPGKVLDWGCGYGQMTALLLRRGVEASAFNYAPDTNGLQRLDRYPQIEALLSSHPYELPYADGEFDAVLSCGVLEHVEFPEASLSELRRVMRAKGRLYVYKLPNRRSYLEWIARRAGLYYHGMYPHDRIYDQGGAEALLRDAGFEVMESRMANVLPLSVTGVWAWRMAGPIWELNRALGRLPVVNRLATNIEIVAVSRG
jgi:SAM-dependent methyltransferase